MHTIYSDGDKSVCELFKLCENRKLKYISITDHNSVSAYYDNDLINNDIYSGNIIVGCEFNVKIGNRAFEIIGYNFDVDMIQDWINKYYCEKRVRDCNKKIYYRYVDILNKIGIRYNVDNITYLEEGSVRPETPIWNEIVRYPENREIIGDDNFESIVIFSRKCVMNPDSPFFLDRASQYPDVQDVVDLIHRAGGLAFFAHPFEYKFDDIINFMDDLVKLTDLDGIECYHPSSENGEYNILLQYAKDNDLYVSGGSDYHGDIKFDIDVGIGKGNLCISSDIIQDWIGLYKRGSL